MIAVEESTFMGPAPVVGVDGPRIRVALPEGAAWARLAVPFIYRPEPGDEVLVIGREAAYFVIGVLHTRSNAVLTFPGDVRLTAPQGRITLASGKGISLDSPDVDVRADRIEMTARTLVQRLTDAYQWVKGLVHLRAGEVQSTVTGTHYQLSGRAFIKAEDEVKIDGKGIHLG